DQIAEEIQELVFSRSFQDGERLDEIRLAKRFGVSRTPLREALKKLTLSGIVEKIPNRGVFVRQPGPIELLDMFE
ncbi:MAG: GntR family transcriptional regulator, partial [Rhodobacterales bacterium]